MFEFHQKPPHTALRPPSAPSCPRVKPGWPLLALMLLLAWAGGCKSISPSNHRDWSPDQAVLSTATIKRNKITVHNIRNCSYLSSDDYVVNHYDKTYELDDLEEVEFIVVPFKDMPAVAHTMMSFGFKGDEHLAVSVEIRREKGESYSAVKGELRQYELMYVVADERDIIKLRTNFRGDDVYLYRLRATPDQAQAMFVNVMERVNKLSKQPEFYESIANNCTTNIANHINHVMPGKIPFNPKLLLNGYSDELAYQVGLIDTRLKFPEARAQA
ncbi:MAG: DUF4105 domain-containing protein, partial [Pirellulales bacterium]